MALKKIQPAPQKKLPPVKQQKIVQQAITKRASAPPRRNVPTLPTQASDRARQAIASRPVMLDIPQVTPRAFRASPPAADPFIPPPSGRRSIDGGWTPPVTYEDGSSTGLSPDWSNAASLFNPGHPQLDAYLERMPRNPNANLPPYSRDPVVDPFVPDPYAEPNELDDDEFFMRLLAMLRRRY